MRFTNQIRRRVENSIILFAVMLSAQLSAQNSILGHVNLDEDKITTSKVHLTKFSIDAIENLKYSEPVAWSPVDNDGSFSFDQKHLSEKNTVYRLYVTQMQKAINDTISMSQAFILSKKDSIYFPESEVPLKNYVSTNAADQEWKKLKTFESELLQSQLAEVDEASRLKSYARDSLRILMVKLMGIKQLDAKKLLDQDIAENPEYYLAVLEELKGSGIESEEYFFLEKKLAFLTQEIVETKYARSKAINFILGSLLLVLVAFLVFQRKKKTALPDLSQQENNIKNLILQGKS
ncbi:MAG: hypothetical protein WA913_02195, partial [Pricia sp.]